MGQEGLPGFISAIIAAAILGAIVAASMIIVTVFSLL